MAIIDPTFVAMSSEIAEAVEQVRRQFEGQLVEVSTDGNKGVFVVVQDVDPGAAYVEERTWLGFQISSAYPHCDVYPHYCGTLIRRDEQPHGDGLTQIEWIGRPGVPGLQISRRSPRWNPRVDTASIKAIKVLTWLKSG